MVSVPNVQWVQFDPTVDPSGFRHLQTTGFIKNLGTAAGQQLNFGSIDTTVSGGISDTKLVLAKVSSFGDASGVFNMKFFLVNTSSFSAGTFRFLERKEIHFQPSLQLGESNNNTPVSVPSIANLTSTVRATTAPQGDGTLSGVLDEDVTQYIWLSVLAREDVNLGQKGGAGQGTFRYRMLYDFS